MAMVVLTMGEKKQRELLSNWQRSNLLPFFPRNLSGVKSHFSSENGIVSLTVEMTQKRRDQIPDPCPFSELDRFQFQSYILIGVFPRQKGVVVYGRRVPTEGRVVYAFQLREYARSS